MRKRHHIASLVFLLFVFCAANTFAQTGNYFINNFTPAQMAGASDQNWGITQDNYQRIFVANSNGVYFNDGKHWTLIELREKARATSLLTDDKGVVYVGGENEFGYLIKNQIGKFEYHSLSERLPEKEQNFGPVWYTRQVGKTIFFVSNLGIYIYENDKIKILSPGEDGFHTAFVVGDHFFVREWGVGFKYFDKGKLNYVEGSEIFKDLKVYSITLLHDNIYLVATRDGIYHLNYNHAYPQLSAFHKFESPIDSWLVDNEVYCGAKISDKNYAFGSLNDGIIIVDNNFNIIKRVSSNNGLQEAAVKSIHLGYDGNIWLALQNGVSFLEYNSPITTWSKGQGIKGGIETVVKFKEDLFIGNDKGLQILDKSSNIFKDLDFYESTWDLFPYKDELLIACDAGLFSYANGKINTILDYPDGFYKIYFDASKPQLFYLGSNAGLVIGRYENHHFTITREENISEVRSIAGDNDGRILFGTSSDGVYYINYHQGITLRQMSEKDGVLSSTENLAFNYNNQIMLATDSGFLRVIETKTGMHAEKLTKFNPFKTKTLIAKAHQIDNEIWFEGITEEETEKVDEIGVLIPQADGNLKLEHKMLKRIRNIDIKRFYQDKDKVYIATNTGLVCYNKEFKQKARNLETYITRIQSKTDSVFYNLETNNIASGISIEYSKNDLSFFPGASDYINSNDLEFSYYLEGLEEKFKPFEKIIKKIDYPNLFEGEYKFHIRARNALGDVGKEVVIPFTVSPPWYRSILAYTSYFVLFLVLIFIIVKLNTKRLKDQNIRLEKIITARTKTIEHQKEEIEHKNQEITDSINYAKRIQDAILPPMEEILTVWNETFVYFQPKDIVSGDFYWYHKINEHEFLIGCADCTGHGVPGGFMSMICSDKLTEGAKISKNPREILFHANNAVKTALRQSQSEGSTKDGMEISVVRFNTSTGAVSYAGANRPMWIIRNNTSEVEEHKPNKASIASSTEYNFEYTQHDLKLHTGDKIYLTSDGYPDQFGGPDGKKFMSKNMKNYLLTIKDLPAAEQSRLLKDNINGWMSNHEQVDDLLVIGIGY